MPALEIVGAPVSAPPSDRPLFKAHKSLPRRRDIESQLLPIDTFSPRVEDGQINGTAVSVAPSLPLTPPDQTQGPDGESPHQHDNVSPAPDYRAATPVTRSHQLSPPTPDITPPRVRDTTPKARPPLFILPSMSSQADSFRTARENLSEEDLSESRNPSAQSLVQRHHRKPTLKQSPLANDIGSGATSPQRETRLPDRTPASENMIDVKKTPRKNNAATMSNSSSPLKSKTNGSFIKSHSVRPAAETNGNVMSSDESNGSPASGRHHSPDTSTLEKFGAEIGWNLTEHEQKLMDRVDTWRHSAGSFTSTIEARVIEPAPQKQRTLRHTEKKTSLRSASSPNPPSARVSLELSVESPPRLVHKSGRISNRDRRSIASDMSISTGATSSNLVPRAEVIPVVVIPQRRSSLKSSAPPSRTHSVTRSQDSSRRNTSVSRSKASDPLPRRRKRTVSDTRPLTAGQSEAERRGRDLGRPAIPPRSSSLSASASRTNSRTTSLTSESLRLHTEAMKIALQSPTADSVAVPLSSPRIILPDRSKDMELWEPPFLQHITDDVERLRAPSLHFTQSSVVSSSPGPIEIKEATTVTFFPHNNESLLLINSYVLPESRAVKALRGRALDQTTSTCTPEQSTAVVNVESPLRNPRTPPEPPALKVVPPTPLEDVDRQLGDPDSGQQRSNRFGRGFGSVRRAFSARRSSDTPAPSVFRSLSTRSARSRRAAKAADNQLHPLWQPRGFWDDFDDSGDERLPASNFAEHKDIPANEDVYVSNSLGLPQKRVIFSGPIALARRISNSRRSRRHPLRHQVSQSNLNLAMEIVRPRSPYQRRAVRFRSQLRTLMPLTAFRDIQQRLRQARQLRTKARLEARRERLKQSIGTKSLASPYSVGAFNHGVPFQPASGPSDGLIHKL